MPIQSFGIVDLEVPEPSFDPWSSVAVAADWDLNTGRSTAVRTYSGQLLESRTISLRFREGIFRNWDLEIGLLRLFDRQWRPFIPDNFHASDLRLTAPQQVQFSTGDLGELGRVDFLLNGATGTGQYLTLLPGINGGSTAAIAADNARIERLQNALQPYIRSSGIAGFSLDAKVYADPEFQAAYRDVQANGLPPQLQGSFSLQARQAGFRVQPRITGSELLDQAGGFQFSVSGTEAEPGFQADVALTGDPLSAGWRLQSRSLIRLENVVASLNLGGTPLFRLSSASIAGQPDVLIRAGDWGLQPDDRLARIETLTGSLTLLPFLRADGEEVYPTLSLSGLELQQDGDVSLSGIQVVLPPEAVGHLPWAGFVPLQVFGLALEFERRTDGTVDLEKPIFTATGRLDVALLQQQLRQLTNSPDLTLEIFGWSGGALTPLTADQTLSLSLQVDQRSGALRLLDAPALRLDLNTLLLPLPGARQPQLSGSLFLGGTDGLGRLQAIPQGLLQGVDLADPAVVAAAGDQALLAGRVRSADGSVSTAVLLRGSLQDLPQANGGFAAGSLLPGTSLQLNGQVQLSGALLSDGLQLGGAIDAALRWRLDALRDETGELTLSGFPTVEAVGLQNLNFELGGVLRLNLEQLAWTASPSRDPLTGRDGLVARARGLSLEVLSGALAGSTFRSSAAEVLLFDLDGNDGRPDHFFIDGLALSLDQARLGPVSAEGLRLQLTAFTNLPDPISGSEGVRGSLRLEADAARLQLGERVQGAILPAPLLPDVAVTATPGPALGGTLDLATGDLDLTLQRFEAALRLGGADVFTLEADGGEAAGALRLELKASATEDDPLLSLPSLVGTLPLLAVERLRGRLSPALQVDGLIVQQDGDVELESVRLNLPEGYLREIAVAGLVPLDLRELRLRFAERSDGSVDLSQPVLGLSGRIDAGLLEQRLRLLLDTPDLSVNLWRFGPDGLLQSLADDSDISLDASVDLDSGRLALLSSPGWWLQLQGLPLPVPGTSRPQLAGDLVLPGTDASGTLLPLPGTLVTSLLQRGGSTLDPAAVISTAPQVLALLRGSLRSDNGDSASLFAADGSLLLRGSLSTDAAGDSRLSLIGDARLSPSLRVPGLSAAAELSTRFNWDLLRSADETGAISLSGRPYLSGARLENLSFRLDDRLDLQIAGIAWNAEPQFDLVAGQFTPGLIAQGTGVTLSFLSGPFDGLSLGGPELQLRLYDLDGGDGRADHLFLDGQVLSLDNLNLDWLQAGSLRLGLNAISNLPVLDPDPGDDRELSGVIALELTQAQVGSAFRFARAAGELDLGRGSLALDLQGLSFSNAGVALEAAGRLRIDPDQPADRWLQLQARGRLDRQLPGLQSLQGDLSLSFDRELRLSGIAGTLAAAAGGRLGDLQLRGDLSFAYDAALQETTLTGAVSLAGIDADATIRFLPDEGGFEASLQISNQNSLQLADWLRLTPQQLQLLYSYSPEQGSQLSLDGNASVSIAGRQVEVAGALQLGFGAADEQPLLRGGSLRLTSPLEGLDLAGFQVDLIADRAGKLPEISLSEREGTVIPRLTGAVRFKDLQDLTIELDPESGGLSFLNKAWIFEEFAVDLTPSGPLNLGLLQIGDGASVRYADGVLSLDPDLSLNGRLLGEVLAPVARVIDNTITPIARPLIDGLKADINLDTLNNLEALKPDWVWDWVWEPVADTGRDLYGSLITSFEATPGNPYRDGRLQVVELLDTTAYGFYQLLKANPSLGKALAQQIGLSDDYVQAVLGGAPYLSLAGGVQALESIGELAAVVTQAEAAAGPVGAGTLVPIPDLLLRLRPGGIAETLGSIGTLASEDSAVLRALLEVMAAWRDADRDASPSGTSSSSGLFQVRPSLRIGVLDDPVATALNAFSGKPFDVIQFGLGVDASLALELNQTIPVTLGPLVLPLLLGGEVRFSGELNASLGLTTSSTALQSFRDDFAVEPLSAVASLLAPAQADGLGLYLAGQPDRPLLRLDPQIRVQGGLDAGAVGVRAFAGLQGSIDVQLASERLYLGELVQALSGDTPPSPEQLGRLFSFDASLSALFGIDTKLLSWENLITRTVPLYRLSVPRVSTGPAVNTDVALELRSYDSAGLLMANLNLESDDGEISGRTDAEGAYRFDITPDPERIGNRDGVLDFRDGMVIAGQRNGSSSGQRISLLDSISGVDLGIPLVGLPGGNLTTLTTLKYTNLLRWRPEQSLAGEPLTPERITEIFAGLIKDAPDSFRNDDFNAYQAIASSDAQVAELGLRTLSFSYQHLAAVLTIRQMLKAFRLDTSDTAAWGFTPDPNGLDSADLVAFGAYGRAIRSRFGPSGDGGINPLDPLGRPPLAAQFDVTDPAHLRAVFAEILAAYPTQRLFEAQASDAGEPQIRQAFQAVGRTGEQQAVVEAAVAREFGVFVRNVATGLSAITSTIAERLAATRTLDALIPLPGAQLVIPAIAGAKRLVIDQLIPSLIEDAQLPDDAQFQQQFFSLFYTPQTIDAVDRSAPFRIRASASAHVQSSILGLDPADPVSDVAISITLVDAQGNPVDAPDYGLSVRFRIGGTTTPGKDYVLPLQSQAQIAYVPPGQSSASLQLDLLPGFYAAAMPLLQVELLSADSGYRVDPEAAVVSLVLQERLPAGLSGARSSFREQQLYPGWAGWSAPIVNPADAVNAVLRGVDQRPDLFVLRPTPGSLPHIENFRPEEGDRLWIDPDALTRFRQLFWERRVTSETARRTALQQLEQRLGVEAINALPPGELTLLLRPLLEALEPLPPVQPEQFNTYGGLLFDLVSQQPLALISADTALEGDQAYSTLSADPTFGSISILSEAAQRSLRLQPLRAISLADRVDPDTLARLQLAGVRLNGAAVEAELSAASPGGRASLALGLHAIAADLSLSNTQGQRDPRLHLAAYGLDGQAGLTPLSYNPIDQTGARFYDRDGDGAADFVTLALVDGSRADCDGAANGVIAAQFAAATVALDPLLRLAPDGGSLLVADPDDPVTAAAVVLRCTLAARPESSNQIGYVALNSDELSSLQTFSQDPAAFRQRAQILFSTLEATDVVLPDDRTSFQRDLPLLNGQSLRFFELNEASLEDITGPDDPRFRWLSAAPARAGESALRVSSPSGTAFSVKLLNADLGLEALIGQEQGIAPVLDFSVFPASDTVTGRLQLAREASFDAVVGFYRAIDAQGAVRDAEGGLLRPGDPGYAVAALREDNRVAELSDLQVADRQTGTVGLQLRESSFLAPFATVRGDTFFAYAEANGDGIGHFRVLGTNSFGLEDLFGGGDRDFDDLILSFSFTGVGV